MSQTADPEASLVPSPHPRRVLVLGASGSIGRAAVQGLAERGHHPVAFVRRAAATLPALAPFEVRVGDIRDPQSVARDAIRGEHFDAIVSCLASRNGAPKDAWAIDYQAHSHALAAAKSAGISHFVLLSAICVQKPMLVFQQAKLAFEKELMASGLVYSIVRPTAYFKSLSGQIERLRKGKPYLLIGDGTLTRCKPISDADLGTYLALCLDDVALHNRILPVGGPGPAITPREQGEELFRLLGLKPRFKHVPPSFLDVIAGALALAGRVSQKAADKAEFARIGRYYATQSMLLFNPETGHYDADATPSFGRDTLFEHYARLIRDGTRDDRGEHAVF